MLIANATLLNGRRADVRFGARIGEIGPGLAPLPDEDVFDAHGGTVLPGLHDHHIHLNAAAAEPESVALGPPGVANESQFTHTLVTATSGKARWVRGVGYHECVAGGLDRWTLDAVVSDTPVRVQHRSGALWVLNSAALDEIGMSGHPDGRLRSDDPRWGALVPRRRPDLTALSRRLSRCGVTGVTDATPGLTADDVAHFARARHGGQLRQRLHCLMAPGTPAAPGVTSGPAKRILSDDTLDLDELGRWIKECHDSNWPVAVHCVTAAQLVVTMTALNAVGTHRLDRIEHAAVVPDECVEDLARLGVEVVTQPNFVAERGTQYQCDVPRGEQHELWRVATLLAAGVRLSGSTDAPHGRPDPWAAMRAAVDRRTTTQTVLNAGERVTAAVALGLFLGRPERPSVSRSIAVGEPADLCVLHAGPAEALAELSSDLVAATVIDGHIVNEGTPA